MARRKAKVDRLIDRDVGKVLSLAEAQLLRSCEQERVRRRKNPIFEPCAILLSIVFRDAWWRDEQSVMWTVQCAI